MHFCPPTQTLYLFASNICVHIWVSVCVHMCVCVCVCACARVCIKTKRLSCFTYCYQMPTWMLALMDSPTMSWCLGLCGWGASTSTERERGREREQVERRRMPFIYKLKHCSQDHWLGGGCVGHVYTIPGGLKVCLCTCYCWWMSVAILGERKLLCTLKFVRLKH